MLRSGEQDTDGLLGTPGFSRAFSTSCWASPLFPLKSISWVIQQDLIAAWCTFPCDQWPWIRWTPFQCSESMKGMPTLCSFDPVGINGMKLCLKGLWGCGGKEERPAELSFVQRTGNLWSLWVWCLTSLQEGAEERHLLGRDLQPPSRIGAVAAGRIKHNRDRTCSCPKSEETFRSRLVPTIPWLLHQLWVSVGAAPVTPVPHENLGVFWEKRGNYLGRTVASLLNLAP